jgi:hypothetical protein
MSGEQIEYSIAFAFCLFATLVGIGRIDIGLPASNKAMMRWGGPVGAIAFGLLLLATFVR